MFAVNKTLYGGSLQLKVDFYQLFIALCCECSGIYTTVLYKAIKRTLGLECKFQITRILRQEFKVFDFSERGVGSDLGQVGSGSGRVTGQRCRPVTGHNGNTSMLLLVVVVKKGKERSLFI